jgi:hypothetical protein
MLIVKRAVKRMSQCVVREQDHPWGFPLVRRFDTLAGAGYRSAMHCLPWFRLIPLVVLGATALACDPPQTVIMPPGITGMPCTADEHVGYCQAGGGVVSCYQGHWVRDPSCSCIPHLFVACAG